MALSLYLSVYLSVRVCLSVFLTLSVWSSVSRGVVHSRPFSSVSQLWANAKVLETSDLGPTHLSRRTHKLTISKAKARRRAPAHSLVLRLVRGVVQKRSMSS